MRCLRVGSGNRASLAVCLFGRRMRTAADFDPATRLPEGESLDFCGLVFTRSALDSAIELAQQDFQGTSRLEDMGAMFLSGTKTTTSLDFSQAVCEWGRGSRVWGNLTRRNGLPDLGRALDDWLTTAAETNDAAHAIAPGMAIKGLGVSFASKHLRMLAPHRYAVLDEVISKGVGFALNPKGYALFMCFLFEFLEKHGLPYRVVTLESGLFYLVRQQVRAKDT